MYVVVGATGNTGSAVVDTLLAAGEKVRVVGRTPSHLERFTKRGAEAAIVDVSDPDTTALTKAFSGAKAVYAMVPPDTTCEDVLAYYGVVAKVIVTALQVSAVTHAVVLSSIGADKSSKTGPVVGLHRLEQLIDAVGGLNALYIRAGYFMENLLPQAGIIRNFGMMAGPLRADLAVPMIAGRDIGRYAAERMLKLDFRDKEARELLGQRDVSYSEAARIVGEAIVNPQLSYMQLPDEQLKPALTQMGMSENMAGLILELSAAL
ncbi:MAG TPA: NAD(P)H-binding protein, partial [Candidatus Acidoferrales bacterium]|nr:NAD(P)H-binding protein [Candidatus Acidoferrales bacterium]